MEFPWSRTSRTLGQNKGLCLCGGFLYCGKQRREQEVSGQLVPLCPNGSYDVVVFLEEATAALRPNHDLLAIFNVRLLCAVVT